MRNEKKSSKGMKTKSEQKMLEATKRFVQPSGAIYRKQIELSTTFSLNELSKSCLSAFVIVSSPLSC